MAFWNKVEKAEVELRSEAEDQSTSGRPTREGDLHLERQGLAPIPDDGRYGGKIRAFTVWFTPNMAPSALFTGTLASASFIGISFVWGVVAIVIGLTIGCVLTGLLAAMGPRTGMAQLPFARLPFGKSIILPGLTNWVSQILWDGINGLFGAEAFKVLFHTPFWFGLLVIIALQGLLAFFGYEAIHTFSKWMAGFLAIIFVILTVKIVSVSTVHIPATSHGANAVGGFILMVTIVASGVMSWAPYASDYTRYMSRQTSSWAIIWRTIAGIGIPAIWLEILGLAAAARLANQTGAGIYHLLGGRFLGVIGMIAVIVTTIAVDALDDYTGSLSLQSTGIPIPRPVSAVVVAAGGFAAALYMYDGNLAGKYTNILLLFGYWIGPFIAIVLVDWWLRRGNVDVSKLAHFPSLPTGYRALTAFVIGWASVIPFMNTSYYEGPVATALHGGDLGYYVGFIVGGVVYYFLCRGPVRQESIGTKHETLASEV
ncbi:MAG: cytosine permease [Acidimicrobiales bacterium]